MESSRRGLLKLGGMEAVMPRAVEFSSYEAEVPTKEPSGELVLNDIHSQLNKTRGLCGLGVQPPSATRWKKTSS